LREERRLRVFENRVLRRIFGPKRDEGGLGLKVKGKVRKWGPFRHFSHTAFCTLTPKEFLHSSLEALHAERRQQPQLAKEL
jgi:hypothetical protein